MCEMCFFFLNDHNRDFLGKLFLLAMVLLFIINVFISNWMKYFCLVWGHPVKVIPIFFYYFQQQKIMPMAYITRFDILSN